MATIITIAGTAVDYRDFSITVPTSPVDIAPSAEIVTNASESIDANDAVTIDIDATTVFEGRTRSGGRISELGGVEVTAAHQARDVFEDTVSLSLTTPTTEAVLSSALSNADGGSALTLDYAGTASTLNNDYNVTDRPVARIFRDMMDREGRLWWVDPAGTTVNVAPPGDRGTWKQIDTTADRATLQRFDTGSVDTVRNAVTVVGTGEEQVRATSENATSISTYGRRPGNSPYNVSYITTQSEAQTVADELVITDPQPEGDLLVASNVGDVTQPLANFEVDVLDDGKNLDVDNLLVEQQTIEQGRSTLKLGAGAGVSIEEINRRTKSKDDQNEPGSVYSSDRIADNSIDSNQLVDSSVIEAKIADLAVTLNKVDADAIDETKIQDNSISTPKLQAAAVVASKIAADTITANEIAADTITALEIAADTLTANEIDTLDLDTNQLTIGADADVQWEFSTDTSGGVSFARLDPSLGGIATIGTVNPVSTLVVLSIFDVESIVMSTSNPTIEPGNDNDGQVGTNNTAFADVWAYDVHGDLIAPKNGDGTGNLGASADVWGRAYVDTMSPDGVSKGNVGVTDDYYEGVRADAFFTESPIPSSEMSAGVDLGELHNSHWYDPPGYVAEGTKRKQAEAEGLTADGDGGQSADGVELGTMSNYLLEVCKAQQMRVEALEDTVADLEQRLSRLEQQS